jgi:hypothetical protein
MSRLGRAVGIVCVALGVLVAVGVAVLFLALTGAAVQPRRRAINHQGMRL